MKFTIITPTIQRKSLLTACTSVEMQSFSNWEHLVQIDSATINESLLGMIRHPQRTISQCAVAHQNGGNTCRHLAWTMATGDYVYYLDDDNWLADPEILSDLAETLETADRPDWALFPILRHGQWFYYDPPHFCSTDTGNLIAKREISRWPNVPQRESDWTYAQGLLNHPYKAFPEFRPIMIMPTSNFGRME